MKAMNDTLNIPHKILECWNNRFRLENSVLIKRYMEFGMDIHLHFTVIGVGFQHQCCATFNSENAMGRLRAMVETGLNVGTQCVEQSVFVGDVKCMNYIKGVGDGFETKNVAISWIRLKLLDQCCGLITDSLYLSFSSGFVSLPAPENGKLRPGLEFGGILTVGDNELPNKMVEAGAEMIKDFSGQNAEAQWRGSHGSGWIDDVKGVLLNSELLLFDDGVRFAFQEHTDLRFEITDILVGPIDLKFDALELFYHEREKGKSKQTRPT